MGTQAYSFLVSAFLLSTGLAVQAQAQVVSGQSYRLQTACGTAQKVISISSDGVVDGVPAVLASQNSAKASQIFKIEKSGTGYRLTAQHSGKVLEVISGDTRPGARIQQFTANGSSHQIFKFLSGGKTGVYRLQNVKSSLFVELQGANTADGTRFIQNSNSGSCAQKFKLVAAAVAAPAPAAPTIVSGPSVSNLTETSATISWTLSEPSTGQIEYGPTTAYGKLSALEASFDYSSHVQILSGLSAGNTYHYRVISKNQKGQQVISPDRVFQTLASAPAPTPQPAPAPAPAPQPAPVPAPVPAPSGQTSRTCAPPPASAAVINVKNAPYNAKGDGITDDTLAIQNAITAMGGSGGTVFIPGGTYMINAIRYANIIGLLVNVSDLTINLAPDAVLKVIPNGSTNYEVIRVTGANVKIVGGKILGERYAHKGTTGEWGYGINIYGSNNYIDSVTANEMWGDGFVIGSAGSNPLNTVVCNVMADSNRRQGLSVITGNGILIKDSTFQNTGTTSRQAGTAPMSGIDIEPDANMTAQNIQILNSKFLNNSTTGILVTLNPAYNGISFIKNVKISGNAVVGNNAHWVDVSPPGGIVLLNVSGGVTISDNLVKGDHGDGIHLGQVGTVGNSAVRNAVVTGNSVQNNGRYGIILETSSTGNAVQSNSLCGANSGSRIVDQAGGNTITGNTSSPTCPAN